MRERILLACAAMQYALAAYFRRSAFRALEKGERRMQSARRADALAVRLEHAADMKQAALIRMTRRGTQ